MTACSFATTKWSHLGAADAATVVLRASAGRYGDDRAIDRDDDALLHDTLADLDALLGLGADPTEVRISRWRDGFPQYEPGHLDRVAAIEADVAEHLPGVAVAGAAYRGHRDSGLHPPGPTGIGHGRGETIRVMRRPPRSVAAVLAFAALATGLGACGSKVEIGHATPTTAGPYPTALPPTTTTIPPPPAPAVAGGTSERR